MKLPSAVIFDWDNTLVDSWPAIGAAMNAMRQQLGYPTWTLDEIRTHCTRAARDSFPEWFGKDWERAYEIYYREFDSIRKNRAIEPLHGAQELVHWLKQKPIPAFIVSNKRGDYLRYEVEKINWQPYFVSVSGAQDAPNDKPHRAHVDHALQAGGISANADVWFVGDSETDMLCARNAGLMSVLIGTHEEAKKWDAAHVYADCEKLLRMLQTLGEASA